MPNPFDDLIPKGGSPFKDLILQRKLKLDRPKMPWQSEEDISKDIKKSGETALPFAVPFARFSKLIPNASRVAKYAADYAGTVGQAAGLGAGINAFSNKDIAEGAAYGGAGATAIHPVVSLAASSNPLARVAGAAGLGALGAWALGKTTGHDSPYIDAAGGLAGLVAGLRGRNVNELGVRDLLGNINKSSAKSVKNASDRLGLSFLTPGEATGSPIPLKIEREVGTDKKAAQELFEKKLSRQKEVKKSIDDLFESISPKNAYKEIEDPLYKKAETDIVEMEKLTPLFKDARIKDSFNKVSSDKDFSNDLKDIDTNSIKYLDYVKKHLDDQIEKAGYGTNRARLIKNSKDKLTTIMDEASHTYKEARKVSSKRQTRDALEKSMNESEISGKSFYDKNLSNDYGFKRLLKSLSDNPDAQQKIKDMRSVFKNIIEPLNARSVASLAQSSSKEYDVSKLGIIKQLNKFLLGGKYDKAIVKLMTNPEWDKEFATIASMKDPSEKARRMADLLSRAGVSKPSSDEK